MENKFYIDCPKFTGRNVPITEIAKAIGKVAQYVRVGLSLKLPAETNLTRNYILSETQKVCCGNLNAQKTSCGKHRLNQYLKLLLSLSTKATKSGVVLLLSLSRHSKLI